MVITEDLARCGVVNGPVWPKPEILNGQNSKFVKYLFSYRSNYDIFGEPDETFSDAKDVYLVSGNPDDVDSLVFACSWSTKHGTYGSTPLFAFLDGVNQPKCPKHYRTMMFVMLSLGHFTFSLKSSGSDLQ